MKFTILLILSAFLSVPALADTVDLNLSSRIQEALYTQIDEEISCVDEEGTTWGGRDEDLSFEVLSFQRRSRSQRLNLRVDVGYGNEYDESVQGHIYCNVTADVANGSDEVSDVQISCESIPECEENHSR